MTAELGAGDQVRHLLAQLADGIVVADPDGCLLFLNPAAEHLLGRPADELIGRNAGFPIGLGPAVERNLVTGDGSERVVEMQTAEVEWEGERAFLATLRDVTERKRLEERYRRMSHTLEAIVEASPLPVIQMGLDFSVTFWNAAADDLFREPDQLARGAPLPIARDARNQELFRVPERLGRGETGVRLEAIYEPGGEDPRQLTVFVSGLRDHEGGVIGMVVILEETTERRRIETEAREDPLTGLANRRVLMRELESAVHRAKAGWPGAVLLVDIDGFKEVNDVHGHSAGDKLLAELAHRLEAAMRPGDLLARYGGDELVAIPARATIEEAEWIAERLRESVEGIALDGVPVTISLSVGVVPIDGSLSVEQALEEADRALYEAKVQGRNRVVIRLPDEAA